MLAPILVAPLPLFAVQPAAPRAESLPEIATVQGPPLEAQSESPGWEFTAGTYLWLYGLDGDVRVQGQQADVDVGFDELFDNLDFAVPLHFEAQKDRFGILLDGTYGKLSVDGTSGPLEAQVDVQQWIVELSGFYRVFSSGKPGPRSLQVDLLAGARWSGQDVELSFVDPQADRDDRVDWVDAIVGARAFYRFTKSLGVGLRGDVGGFGIGGSSDFSWNVSTDLGWEFAEHWWLSLGYRSLSQDYSSGDFEYDVTTAGPMIGILYH